MMAFLILVGMVAAIFGMLMASAATAGVALMAFACFCGILARIAQAGAATTQQFSEHKQLADLIRQTPVDHA